jgi:uncharacterized tellurite resistance protein B-like protein
MSLLDRLFGAGRDEASPGSPAVRRIAAELAALPPAQARVLAAFAYLLGRVANADSVISDAESASIEKLVSEVGGVPAEQATLVAEIAKSQNRLFGHVENFQVTRELREAADEPTRKRFLDCLFAVAASEDGISAEEEAQVRQIASELGLTHGDYVTARGAWSAQRTVMRNLHRPPD